MVHDRVMAGKKALGAWFQQCRMKVGGVGIETFKKLSSLVELSMLYMWSRVWGCCWSLEALKQVQLTALHMFFEVGTVRPGEGTLYSFLAQSAVT